VAEYSQPWLVVLFADVRTRLSALVSELVSAGKLTAVFGEAS
jgi:hypothetical protein